MSPRAWGDSFGVAPDLCSAAGERWNGALLRRWQGSSARMEQPPLDHHYLVLHLGGPKRIKRRGAGSVTTNDAEAGSVTLVAAGASYSWSTEGPIGFAHLYLSPNAVGRIVGEEFDREPRSVELIDCTARRLPLLSAIMSGMIEQLETPGFGSRLVLDTLLHSLIVGLLCECSTLSQASSLAAHSMAPRRLRRVLDFIEANLADDIELDDLASVAGSSRFHFSRAFRDATGFPPYRYLVHRRVDSAKTLLLQGDLSIDQVAAQCGFKSSAQFAVMFKQVFGTTPSRFRREH